MPPAATGDLRRPHRDHQRAGSRDPVGQMLGEVEPENLVTPEGLQPGDAIVLTKGIAIEGTAILARELGWQLEGLVPPEVIERAAGYLHDPGISVVADARIAAGAARLHAMHDPTEGGLATAWPS